MKVRIGIIFRGTGKRVSSDGIKAYHPGVNVYWQQNACAGTKFSLEWIQNTLKAGTFSENRKEFVLFCDNLSSQVSEEFLEAVKNINGIV